MQFPRTEAAWHAFRDGKDGTEVMRLFLASHGITVEPAKLTHGSNLREHWAAIERKLP